MDKLISAFVGMLRPSRKKAVKRLHRPGGMRAPSPVTKTVEELKAALSDLPRHDDNNG